eukprot:5122384-Pleurochrysis_carterae.AAC.1
MGEGLGGGGRAGTREDESAPRRGAGTLSGWARGALRVAASHKTFAGDLRFTPLPSKRPRVH